MYYLLFDYYLIRTNEITNNYEEMQLIIVIKKFLKIYNRLDDEVASSFQFYIH